MMAMVAGIAGTAVAQKRWELQQWAVTHVQPENMSLTVTPTRLEMERDLHTHMDPVDRLAPTRNVLTAREAGTATQGPPLVPHARLGLQQPMAVQHVVNAALARMQATKPVNAPTVVPGPFPTQGRITASVVTGAVFHLKVTQAAHNALWVSMRMIT